MPGNADIGSGPHIRGSASPPSSIASRDEAPLPSLPGPRRSTPCWSTLSVFVASVAAGLEPRRREPALAVRGARLGDRRRRCSSTAGCCAAASRSLEQPHRHDGAGQPRLRRPDARTTRRADSAEVARLTARLQPHARPPARGAPRRRRGGPARPGGGAPRASPRTSTTRSTRRSPRSCCAWRRRSRTRRPTLRRELRRDQAARQPGDGRAAAARPPAAPHRARRPRPDPRPAHAGARLRRAHGHRRGLPPARRHAAAVGRPAARHLPRRAGEPLQRGAALGRRVASHVELSFVGRTVLRVRDDGRGFQTRRGQAGSACRACASGRLLVGGQLAIHSGRGGTTVELTMH